MIPKSTLFRPRFSHSASVFKNQIIIFGGMLAPDEQTDEMMILSLFDKQDLMAQKDTADYVKICPVCTQVYNLDTIKIQQLKEKQPDNASKQEQTPANQKTETAESTIEINLFTNKKEEKIEEEQGDPVAEQKAQSQQPEGRVAERDLGKKILLKSESAILQSIPTLEVPERPTCIKPQVSSHFLAQTANMMQSPFSAFGLLIDNIIHEQDKSLTINLMCIENQVKKQEEEEEEFMLATLSQGDLLRTPITQNVLENQELYFQIYDDVDGAPAQHFMSAMQKFDIKKEIRLEQLMGRDAPAEGKKWLEWATNIKLAGLRLGQSVLVISSNQTLHQLNVAYLSSNSNNNPVTTEVVVFAFSYDTQNKSFLSENGVIYKQLILRNVCKYMDEEQLLVGHGNQNGNYVYIFDLKRILKKNRENKLISDYEFAFNKDKVDLNIKKQGVSKYKHKELIDSLADYSLYSYISCLYLRPNQRIMISFNHQKIEMVNYLDTIKSLHDKKQLAPLDATKNPQYHKLAQYGSAAVYQLSELAHKQRAFTENSFKRNSLTLTLSLSTTCATAVQPPPSPSCAAAASSHPALPRPTTHAHLQ